MGARVRRRAVERPITEGDGRSRILRREAVFRRGLAIADVLAAGLALVVCVSVLGDDNLTPLALLALPLVVAAGKAHRLYDRDELLLNKTTLDQAPQLFQCATLYTLLVVLLQEQFIHGGLGIGQAVALWATLFVSALLARRLARYVARRITSTERCLFVGSDESYARLGSKLEDSCRATLVGRMSLTSVANEAQLDAGATMLRHLIDELDVDRVIIEPSEAQPQVTLDFVREAKATSVRVSLLPRILEVVGSTIEVDDLDGLTLLGVRRFGLSRSSRLLKRGLDITGATLGLIAMAPFMAVVSMLIKLDSPGGVFFRQSRVGREGRPFEMLKFRTMVVDAERLLPQLQARNEAGAGLFKITDDPRTTRLGRLLRRTSLDELPQLVNVLRGEMSLVGPRPLVLDEDAQITGLDRRRLALTPGLTGHWQIAGSSRIPLSEMVKLDYIYVAGWSLWTDAKIMLRTIAHVLARRGM
ncbi:MAG: exopolysaccharide biosynthesis polyprenyl glycosylphosphotransferase [Actinomycetota bacterium]|nr:exopolysaccharide biosynthesis polyprenyl glycosylphosphotransferase [Actinomycetota bacterium]